MSRSSVNQKSLLEHLNRAVNDHFKLQCELREFRTGGDHKTYDVHSPIGPLAVVRMAHPSVTRDQMESEVATMKYIAACGVPVPEIYAWDSGTNATGPGYILMEKVPGHSAYSMWHNMCPEDKEKIVAQIAQYLLVAFEARFDQAGTLYLSHSADKRDPFYVGPIISKKYSSQDVTEGIKKLLGPFNIDNTSDWVSYSLRAQIFALKSEVSKHNIGFDADAALTNMDAALRLCSIYPGNNPVIPQIKSPQEPFSFQFADISLKDIMIDDTYQITGFTNFERTMVAPLWACARVPQWLHPDEVFSDITKGERIELCDAFFLEIKNQGGKEWKDAHKLGREFRNFMNQLNIAACAWSLQGPAVWVQERYDWACNHPGVGFPGNRYHIWANRV